jgi:hypothetical protein
VDGALPCVPSCEEVSDACNPSASDTALLLFLTLWRTAKKWPCRNYQQDLSLANRGGEIRCRAEGETF